MYIKKNDLNWLIWHETKPIQTKPKQPNTE